MLIIEKSNRLLKCEKTTIFMRFEKKNVGLNHVIYNIRG